MTVLEQLPRGARICIIRLRSLGDCVLTTPCIALLKQARPDLEIGVVVEPRFAAVFENHPHVSAIIEPSWQAVRRWKPVLCINLHGGSRSMWMTALSGARWRVGFSHHADHAALQSANWPRASHPRREPNRPHRGAPGLRRVCPGR